MIQLATKADLRRALRLQTAVIGAMIALAFVAIATLAVAFRA